MADEVVVSLDDTTRFLAIRNKKLYIETKNRTSAEEGLAAAAVE
jgi:hypothetical protein